MSHLGFRILYRILNDDPRTLAERAYAPWVDMQQRAHGAREAPGLARERRGRCATSTWSASRCNTSSRTPTCSRCSISAASRCAASTASDDDPLVIAGGPVATHAEPMAAFIDAFLIGDGEEAATEIALTWADAQARGPAAPRAADAPGVSDPRRVRAVAVRERRRSGERLRGRRSRTKRGRRAVPGASGVWSTICREFPFPDDGPVGGPEAIFDRMSIEVARGCTEGCRFCQAGMIYRPVRERDPEQVIVDTVLTRAREVGARRGEPDRAVDRGRELHLAADQAPGREDRARAREPRRGLAARLRPAPKICSTTCGKVRASGLTFAPEAGTQRMRDVINKNVTEEQLMETAERVFSRGFDKMKLYFIIGLPTEEDEDVLGIVERRQERARRRQARRQAPEASPSASRRTCPSRTRRFSGARMDPLDEVRRKQAMLHDAARARTRPQAARARQRPPACWRACWRAAIAASAT